MTRLDYTVSINEAVTLLKQGEVVAFPTETVYGLAADALNARALDALYRLKGRPKKHPVIVHLADANQVGVWVSEYTAVAQALAQALAQPPSRRAQTPAQKDRRRLDL